MKIVLFANTDWYLYNFRMNLACQLKQRGHEVFFISPPGRYGIRFIEHGFKWIPIPMNRRSMNPLTEIKLIYKICSVYYRLRPVLAHHFTIKSAVYGSIAAIVSRTRYSVNAITGMGYVFTRKNKIAYLLQSLLRIFFIFLFKRKNACLIVQNKDDADLMLKLLLNRPINLVTIRGSGVNTDRFHPCTKPSIEKKMRVLLATRLLKDKGVQEFAQAAIILRDERNLQFWIAGVPDEGNPSSVSKEVIDQWQFEPNLRYLGLVEDMPKLLQKVDIVALPSYREGTPKILLEAASCGLPLIATDVPGCREIVIHGKNGLLIEPKDPQALAQAVLFLARNQERAHQMGSQGRRIVKDQFSDRQVIDATIRVYNSLLAPKGLQP